MKHRLLLAQLTLIVGCASEPQSKNSDAPDVVLETPPSSTATAMASALPRKEPPSALAAWSLPAKQGPAIGTECPRDNDEALAKCGTKSRVSLELQPKKPLRGELPCKLEPLGEEGKFSMNAASACIDGDYLVISTVCMVCRMPDVGSAALARMSELTLAQHKQLAKLVGLADDKAPSSADGWRQVVKKR
jgi:hypothetical protein